MMEILNPKSQPTLERSPVDKEQLTVKIGSNTYKLIYVNKISLACPRKQKNNLLKIVKYLPDFAESPGLWIHKINEKEDSVDTDAGPQKKPKSTVSALGVTSEKSKISQSIPLTLDMASALLHPDYVSTCMQYLTDVMEKGDLSEHLDARKPAVQFRPPIGAPKTAGRYLGKLVVGTAFSNYTQIRHLVSEDEYSFDDDGGPPKILGQITMCDSAFTSVNTKAPPMIHFSCPAPDLMALLSHTDVVEFCRDKWEQILAGEQLQFDN